MEEEEFFKAFSDKSYTDTIPTIVQYFQKYSIALSKHIWNDKQAIEQDLGGPIDVLFFGDVFMLGPELADRFEAPFVVFHPGGIFDGELNSVAGISVHPAQVTTAFLDSDSATGIKLVDRIVNHFLSYFIDYQIAKSTIEFENNFRKEMGLHLIPENNNYLTSSPHYANKHSNLYPIAKIVGNSPGFAPAVEVPPFVHYVGPVIPEPVPLAEVSRRKYPDVDDLIAWMDNDDRPIILMSFSTVAHFSPSGMDAIISSLSSMKSSVRVLWVVREAARHSLPSNFLVPDNFLLVRFIPQFEVLGHEKVRLFFSVGGINSVLESIIQQTPILCCGSHFEQNFNCDRVQSLGIGARLNKDNLNANSIREHAQFLLHNPEAYSDTLKELKTLFLSSNGTTRAADIMEQSIRIGSNKFLLPQTVHSSMLEKTSLDIIFVFVVLTLLV
eukprot:CAMPEP_0206186462 /NCGR_PEP_ID=MMETSP0166-20121206/2416_1 /ASSEMBLY_ACC=CAM_ASM_000260 /TAXON_ID=95228 /ORGANISM="Vannella robusta, Strain DIVA3 518/3/11/1/6" /LENGTH=440 /DNA_ID=CAMNT_0053601849 /DNA_START=273 /DNA_END=1592 /DNA_ORIENTATION=-